MKRIWAILFGLFLVVSFVCPPQTIGASDDWTRVSDRGFGENNYAAYPITTFNDWLIVSSGNDTGGRAAVYRSNNGTSWEQINETGFGEDVDIVYDFAILNNYLYALGYDYSAGTTMWRTSNMSTWEKIGDDPTGMGNGGEPSQFAVFAGDLYVNYQNGVTSKASVWKSEGGEDDWSEVFTEDLINRDNYDGSLAAYGDYLYFTVQADGGARIYRSTNGNNWQWIVGGGIDDPENNFLNIFAMNDYIWAGSTKDNAVPKLYRSSGGDWEEIDLPEDIDSNTRQIVPIDGHDGWNYFSTFINNGFVVDSSEIWRYKDGVWELYAEKDLGDMSGTGLIGPIYYDGYMYVGTQDLVDGGSVWRKYIGVAGATSQTTPTPAPSSSTTLTELPQTGMAK